MLFREDLVIPKKGIRINPNNKPWVQICKNTIIQRNICFNQDDVTQYKVLQKQVKKELKLARLNYKDKVEYILVLEIHSCMGGGEVHDGDAI